MTDTIQDLDIAEIEAISGGEGEAFDLWDNPRWKWPWWDIAGE